MSAIRDYLNFGVHHGLEACRDYNGGKWDPNVFKRFSANLFGEVQVIDENTVIINNYPTTANTVLSLEFEMTDLCNALNVKFLCKKHCMVIQSIF